MFLIQDPQSLNKPWILSNSKDSNGGIAISEDTTKHLRTNDVIGVQFLHDCFKNQFSGAILNEESDMNMQLQVAAFFNANCKAKSQKCLILVIAPDHLLSKWHYHLSNHANFSVRVLTTEDCAVTGKDQESRLVLLLGMSNLKLAEKLLDFEYFSVVIDYVDEVANKLVVRKLYGSFNVGLTSRNFYVNPDQKLQWHMLNWTNPGCVGKLNHFPETDNDNFANFRNNYRHWWLRLTWDYCESFTKLNSNEQEEYRNLVNKWVAEHPLERTNADQTTRKVRKRKMKVLETSEDHQVTRRMRKPSKRVVNTRKDFVNDLDDASSNDTIIYEAEPTMTNEVRMSEDGVQDFFETLLGDTQKQTQLHVVNSESVASTNRDFLQSLVKTSRKIGDSARRPKNSKDVLINTQKLDKTSTKVQEDSDEDDFFNSLLNSRERNWENESTHSYSKGMEDASDSDDFFGSLIKPASKTDEQCVKARRDTLVVKSEGHVKELGEKQSQLESSSTKILEDDFWSTFVSHNREKRAQVEQKCDTELKKTSLKPQIVKLNDNYDQESHEAIVEKKSLERSSTNSKVDAFNIEDLLRKADEALNNAQSLYGRKKSSENC